MQKLVFFDTVSSKQTFQFDFSIRRLFNLMEKRKKLQNFAFFEIFIKIKLKYFLFFEILIQIEHIKHFYFWKHKNNLDFFLFISLKRNCNGSRFLLW